MLSRLIIELDFKNYNFNKNMGSQFHGFIFKLMNNGYAEKLHKQSLKPYSMNFTRKSSRGSKNKSIIVWTINSLKDEFKKNVLDVLMQENVRTVSIENKDLEIPIVSKKLENRILIPDIDKPKKEYSNVSIEFLSATAFKSSGEYVFLPSVKLIFQSLINKNNSFLINKIDLEESLEKIEKKVRISSYRLNSTRFYLEGIRIPAFRGSIRLNIFDREVRHLVNHLLDLGEFSGVGIKSTMGMGHIARK